MLLPLLRSQVQGDLLSLLFLHPEDEFSLSEIARFVGASLPAVHHEVTRLINSGLLLDRRQGNVRLVRADMSSVLASPLSELMAVTYGPRAVLVDVLTDVEGVEAAYIYGSWAARYRGQPGSVPGDVDLLVVGEADIDDLEEAVRPAQARLRRQVNVRRVSPATWRQAQSGDGAPFLATLLASPLVELELRGGVAA